MSLRANLITTAALFYERGWMWGTAGNLSARSDDGIWITASGVNKGSLGIEDFLLLDHTGEIQLAPPNKRCSAETSLHLAVYQHLPRELACLHVHSTESNLVCQLLSPHSDLYPHLLPLPPLEMLKGVGIWEEHPSCSIPVFNNHASVPLIAEELSQFLLEKKIQVPGFLIKNHGLTVWGKDIREATNRLECFSYIFRYMIQSASLSTPL